MTLLTCIVTHNRLDYTKRCVQSWIDTLDYHNAALVIVDNASTDGTREYLATIGRGVPIILNDTNLFPGAATNIGWHHGIKAMDDYVGGRFTHLHRSDNDIEYLPGWINKVRAAFKETPKLGQLGLLNMHEDHPDGPPLERQGDLYVGSTGGNCVIPRSLWDEGLRWAPGAWRPGGRDEDTQLTETIQSKGMVTGRLAATVANNISFHRYDDYPDYYRQTAALRGLVAETSV